MSLFTTSIPVAGNLVCIGKYPEADQPQQIVLGGITYFVCRDETGPYLLSATCPHRGGKMTKKVDGGFECPLHGWKFDGGGRCTNVDSEQMERVSVFESDGRLYVDRRLTLPVRGVNRVNSPNAVRPNIDIRLHAHACVEMVHEGFSLLTDPWLDGPAFFGSWTQYPEPVVSPADLHPSAIWISHEHSDHLHPQTLEKFDKATPCYFPGFPNRRIERALTGLGFTELHPMRFGESYKIGPGFEVTSFAPQSFWNDAIGLFSIDGFNILDINDAGINQTVARALPEIDLLMGFFSAGASGFPIRFRGISDDDKRKNYDDGKTVALETLLQAAEIYGAAAVLPIASFFTLWHPEHADYRRSVKKNSVVDVVRHFENTGIGVVDLHPGEAWNCRSNKFQRQTSRRERDATFKVETIEAHAREGFDSSVFADNFPDDKISRERVVEYFDNLNRVPHMQFAEDMNVSVIVVESFRGRELFQVNFEILGGRLSVSDSGHHRVPDLRIWIPRNLMASIAIDDISWDEATVSLWCEVEQVNGQYFPKFWRALQAPYYAKSMPDEPQGEESDDLFNGDMPIQAALEASPVAARILSRFGLNCLACGKAHQETLLQGARAHGLDQLCIDRMLAELNCTARGTEQKSSQQKKSHLSPARVINVGPPALSS